MKPTISSKQILKLIGLSLMGYVPLVLAVLAFIFEDYILSAVLAVSSVIISMDFPAALICFKLDERFDRLEKLLEQNCKKEEEIDKSSEV